MIQFNRINIKGFGSIVNSLDYKLNSKGINIITGHNGVGKTTIFSALTWGIYGKPIKEKSQVETWEDLRPNNFMGTKVTLYLKVNNIKVKIIRCKNYGGKIEGHRGKNRLILYYNNKYQKFRGNPETQKEIYTLLGMSYDIFKNTILFGQKLTRLLEQSGPDQNKVFEEAFDIDFIKKSKDIALKKYGGLNTELNQLQLKLASIKSDRNLLSASLDKLKTNYKNKVDNLKTQLKIINYKINKAEDDKKKYDKLNKLIKIGGDKVKKFKTSLKRFDELDKEVFRMNNEALGKEGDIQDLEQEINQLKKELISRTCLYCGQKIKSSKHEEITKNHKKNIKDLRSKININISELIDLKNRLEKKESSLKKYDSKRKKLNEIEISLENMRNYGFDDIEYNPKMLNSLKIEQIDIKKKLHESRDSWDSEKYQKQQEELETKKLQIQETELKIDGLSKDIQLHDWLIKDPLSNKGLKAYIFNNMLDGVNNEAQKYSKRLGYHINFRIDLDSGNKKFETTIYEDNEERSYNDLSGGQQQLVIICTVFAIHDVYAKARQINILLMDEIFESLDSANIEKVSELIELKAQDMSLHLMTHNPHFSINYNNSIRLIRDSQRRTKIVL